MSNWNMPPGVSTNDIPGNEPDEPVMFDRFTLHITLGNVGMQHGLDVARALREVADRIEDQFEARGTIRDVNGNDVGYYKAERVGE